jgi:hypothetical protein
MQIPRDCVIAFTGVEITFVASQRENAASARVTQAASRAAAQSTQNYGTCAGEGTNVVNDPLPTFPPQHHRSPVVEMPQTRPVPPMVMLAIVGSPATRVGSGYAVLSAVPLPTVPALLPEFQQYTAPAVVNAQLTAQPVVTVAIFRPPGTLTIQGAGPVASLPIGQVG